MSIKWVIALMTGFVILSLLSGIIEMQYLEPGETGVLQTILTSPKVTTINNPLTAPFTFLSVAWNIIKALWSAFWWNYAFFQGYWVIVKYAIFWPISVGLIVAIIMALRGVASG